MTINENEKRQHDEQKQRVFAVVDHQNVEQSGRRVGETEVSPLKMVVSENGFHTKGAGWTLTVSIHKLHSG